VLLTCRNVLLAADASEASARAIRAAESWVLNDGANATIMVSHEPTYEQMLAHAKSEGRFERNKCDGMESRSSCNVGNLAKASQYR
jgi:hypothetical protein